MKSQTDWVKAAGIAAGALAILDIVLSESQKATQSWQQVTAQNEAIARSQRDADYQRRYNAWVQNNWNNPNPPPPPMPQSY